MRIKVKHRISGEVMYAVNFTDNGYVICIDYNGKFLMYSSENINVIDPDYLPNKDESAKMSDFLPKDFFNNLGKPDMSGQSWE